MIIMRFSLTSGKRMFLFSFLILLSSLTSFAQTQNEFWPEINGFINLNDQFRAYLVAAYAQGKESEIETLDMAAYIDVSIKPVFRPKYFQADWQRSRFLWARIGFDHVFKSESGSTITHENRGIISIYGKAHLPADIWLENRARADLRWIGDVYSTRYRYRLEATREFSVFKNPAVPYLNCEFFNDTRYSGLSRLLVMAGAEYTVSKYFRFEVYLAPQFDYQPERADLLVFGVVAKLYL
jgi:hypothetical protein